MQWLGAHGQPWYPPGHPHVRPHQRAEQAEPPFLHGKPGGEGACTSPAEPAQPGPTIVHLQ